MMWNGASVRADMVAFAVDAAKFFRDNPKCHTFTRSDIKMCEPIALRWSYDRDGTAVWSVVVFEVGSTPILVEEP